MCYRCFLFIHQLFIEFPPCATHCRCWGYSLSIRRGPSLHRSHKLVKETSSGQQCRYKCCGEIKWGWGAHVCVLPPGEGIQRWLHREGDVWVETCRKRGSGMCRQLGERISSRGNCWRPLLRPCWAGSVLLGSVYRAWWDTKEGRNCPTGGGRGHSSEEVATLPSMTIQPHIPPPIHELWAWIMPDHGLSTCGPLLLWPSLPPLPPTPLPGEHLIPTHPSRTQPPPARISCPSVGPIALCSCQWST